MVEDILFYFAYAFIKASENDKVDDESFLKILKRYIKIMNNMEMDRRNLSDDDEDDYDDDDDDYKKEKRKINILKVFPWVSFNLNIVIQIVAFICFFILMKRIKINLIMVSHHH